MLIAGNEFLLLKDFQFGQLKHGQDDNSGEKLASSETRKNV